MLKGKFTEIMSQFQWPWCGGYFFLLTSHYLACTKVGEELLLSPLLLAPTSQYRSMSASALAVLVNPITPRTAKTPWSFGRSEYNRVNVLYVAGKVL